VSILSESAPATQSGISTMLRSGWPFACDECRLGWESEADWRQHIGEVHGRGPSYAGVPGDVVVTVPMAVWDEWLDEGDLPGDGWSGNDSFFNLWGAVPRISAGDRVYIVAHGRLRGYAPLVRIDRVGREFALVRRDGAVACTLPESIRGFRGWRYRWWLRAAELPFPNWREK